MSSSPPQNPYPAVTPEMTPSEVARTFATRRTTIAEANARVERVVPNYAELSQMWALVAIAEALEARNNA